MSRKPTPSQLRRWAENEAPVRAARWRVVRVSDGKVMAGSNSEATARRLASTLGAGYAAVTGRAS